MNPLVLRKQEIDFFDNHPGVAFDESPSVVNAKVSAFEQYLSTLPQVDLQTSHVVHGKMCARTIVIPAGGQLVGAKTNFNNICVIYGDIMVTTDKGLKRLTGFHVLPAVAGYKRAGKALAETYWTTIWPTELTDVTEIEDEMTDEAEMLQTRKLLSSQNIPRLEE